MQREDNYLKYIEVPEWVILRFQDLVSKTGGKKEFCEKFKIGEAYMSLLWNGKRHPPEGLRAALGVKIVVTPIKYEPI